MVVTSSSSDTSGWCPSCLMKFGALAGEDGAVRCPICKKLTVEGSPTIVRRGPVSFECLECLLTFSAILREGEIVKCPLGSNGQHHTH